MNNLGRLVGPGTTRFVRELQAPRSAVWAALTDPAIGNQWFIPNPCVDHRVGGRWWFVSADDAFFQGTITRFEEGTLIEYRYDSGSIMSFSLSDASEGQCTLTFEHVVPSDFLLPTADRPSGDGWDEQPAGRGTPQPALNASWHSNLDALELVLADAPDEAVEATARRETSDPEEWRVLVAQYRSYLESSES